MNIKPLIKMKFCPHISGVEKDSLLGWAEISVCISCQRLFQGSEDGELVGQAVGTILMMGI